MSRRSGYQAGAAALGVLRVSGCVARVGVVARAAAGDRRVGVGGTARA